MKTNKFELGKKDKHKSWSRLSHKEQITVANALEFYKDYKSETKSWCKDFCFKAMKVNGGF